MIGIIGAMTLEIEGLRERMTEKTEKTVSGIKYVSGKLENQTVVTAVSGIGKGSSDRDGRLIWHSEGALPTAKGGSEDKVDRNHADLLRYPYGKRG